MDKRKFYATVPDDAVPFVEVAWDSGYRAGLEDAASVARDACSDELDRDTMHWNQACEQIELRIRSLVPKEGER